MIYLIDDKKLRQEKDFGWTIEKLNSYNGCIIPIYTLEELESRAEEVFKDYNTVLYHESFLNKTIKSEQAETKRQKLEQFAKNHQTFNLVIFSGSKNFRNIRNNTAYLPVSILYSNLNLFVERYAQKDSNIQYLAYGENPKIESELLEKLDNALSKIENEAVLIENQTNLFVPSMEKYIQEPIVGAHCIDFFDPESDYEISEFINENLMTKKFNNIFLPLCFGNSLSDYNGLRLAAHIRCTESPNQLSNIFIYGFVSMDYLIENEYFNILRTKNVKLIPFSKKSFKYFAEKPKNPFLKDELPFEISKLKLNIPKDFEDNHSIANIWGMYRLIELDGKSIKDFDSLINRKDLSNIYFKWLIAKYKVDLVSEEIKEVRKAYAPKLPGPKLLGKIDLPIDQKRKK